MKFSGLDLPSPSVPASYMLSGMRDKPIREQLIEGRAKIQSQLDFLKLPYSNVGLGYRPDKKGAIERLEATLREIDDALANLKDDDP